MVTGRSLLHADQFVRPVDVEPNPLKNIDLQQNMLKSEGHCRGDTY